jgi:hypothetical protein
MAALFSFDRPRTGLSAAANILTFRRDTSAGVSRPPLSLRWQQDVQGRLYAHWEAASAAQIGPQPARVA